MGINITATVREYLIAEGIMFDRACTISEEIDKLCNTVEWLSLLDGTTFNRGYTPTKREV